jgi:hypothetical protein
MTTRKAFTFADVCMCSGVALAVGLVATPALRLDSTATINSSGELAKAILLYAQDHDGVFPITAPKSTSGRWIVSSMVPVPSNVINRQGWTSSSQHEVAQSHWANAIRIYVTSNEHYRDASQEIKPLPQDAFVEGVQPIAVGLTMNGLLNSYGQAAVVNPGIVPLVWAGAGSAAFRGRATANPALTCFSNNAPCRFSPQAPTDPFSTPIGTRSTLLGPSNTFVEGTVWSMRLSTNSGGGTLATVDGAARFQEWGTVADPSFTTSAAQDIFASITNDNGRQAFHYWATVSGDCTDVSDVNTVPDNTYVCYFRPDRVK